MTDPARPTTARATSVTLSIVMILLGLILLLPGLCSGLFMIASIANLFRSPTAKIDSLLLGWMVVGFGVSAGGIGLIVRAFRRLQRRQRGRTGQQ